MEDSSNKMQYNQKDEMKNAIKAAFPHTIPIFTGFIILGITYGLLMQTKGYEWYWSVLMSLIAYCGSMQFVAITLLTIPFNPLQAFLLSLMVNARHLFYGISMLEKYKGFGKVRALLIYLLCDETFFLSSSIEAPEGVNNKYFYVSISILNYLYWVLGSFLGGIVGKMITFNTKGLDFVLTCLFVVLFIDQLKNKNNRISGIIGVTCAIISLALFGANNLVIPAMIFILIILILRRKLIWNLQKSK